MHHHVERWEPLTDHDHSATIPNSLCVIRFHFIHQSTDYRHGPHKSPLDEINEIRRNAADSLWVLKVTRRRSATIPIHCASSDFTSYIIQPITLLVYSSFVPHPLSHPSHTDVSIPYSLSQGLGIG